MVAEQFGTVVDDAVAVEINGKQTVFGGHPAGALGKAVVVQIKPDAAVGQRQSLYAVAVEIKDDGGINTGSLCCVGGVRVSRQRAAGVAGKGFGRIRLLTRLTFRLIRIRPFFGNGAGALLEIGNSDSAGKLFPAQCVVTVSGFGSLQRAVFLHTLFGFYPAAVLVGGGGKINRGRIFQHNGIVFAVVVRPIALAFGFPQIFGHFVGFFYRIAFPIISPVVVFAVGILVVGIFPKAIFIILIRISRMQHFMQQGHGGRVALEAVQLQAAVRIPIYGMCFGIVGIF